MNSIPYNFTPLPWHQGPKIPYITTVLYQEQLQINMINPKSAYTSKNCVVMVTE